MVLVRSRETRRSTKRTRSRESNLRTWCGSSLKQGTSQHRTSATLWNECTYAVTDYRESFVRYCSMTSTDIADEKSLHIWKLKHTGVLCLRLNTSNATTRGLVSRRKQEDRFASRDRGCTDTGSRKTTNKVCPGTKLRSEQLHR